MSGANYNQNNYIFRADNGGETGCVAAQLAALNVSPANLRRNTNYRVRFGFTNSPSGGVLSTKLQVNKNGGGWVDASATAPVKTNTSPNIADGTATTQQITSGSFVPGEVEASISNTLNSSVNFASPNSSEVEFCFQINSVYANVGDTIQLRLASMNTYSQTPSFVVTADPSLYLSRLRNLRTGSRSPS